ncbi:hypothetical protein AB0D04_24510 [Streptomyces sp. NPDC048483]|uniref:hypothetical protein n=1 Tax=Streptomyces sp. NPDC048483 TaxID=3154927 RepID=UPI0034375FF2
MAQLGTVVASAGALAALALLTGVLAIHSQAQQRILGLRVDQLATNRALEAAAAADLIAFEDPCFHDRLQCAVHASRGRPVLLVLTLTTLVRATVSTLAVAAAFLTVARWLLPFLALVLLPMLYAARNTRQARYRLHLELSEIRRTRACLERLLTSRDDAKEIRAVGPAPSLQRRWPRGNVTVKLAIFARHAGLVMVKVALTDSHHERSQITSAAAATVPR